MLQNLETTYFLAICILFSTLGNNSTLNGWKEDEHLIISSLLVPTVHTSFSQSSGQSYSGEAYWVLTERWWPNYSWAVQCAVVTLPYLPIVLFCQKLSKSCLCFFFFSFARLSTYFLLIQPQTLSYMENLTCLASGYSTLWLSSFCPSSLVASSCTLLWIWRCLPSCSGTYLLSCFGSSSPLVLFFLTTPLHPLVLFPSVLVKHVCHIRGPQHLNRGSFISIYSRSPLLAFTWASPPVRSVAASWWVV